jgi:predicted nucleic acid-binding protein
MILVDSSVWIDYFRGRKTPETDLLDSVLGGSPVAIGDLILAEVLQGFASDKEFRAAESMLGALSLVVLGGKDIAIKAAKNHRLLRARGVTVRKTIDTIIATRCIEDSYALLFSDRDFKPFVDHLGLQSALSLSRLLLSVHHHPVNAPL